jgi:hypothetical protein
MCPEASAHLLASPLPGPRDASVGGARSWTLPLMWWPDRFREPQ